MCECKFWASEFRGPCRPWSRSYRCCDHLMLVLEIEPKSCASPYWLFTIEPTPSQLPNPNLGGFAEKSHKPSSQSSGDFPSPWKAPEVKEQVNEC